MNVRPHRPSQSDVLERLCQLWELTPANTALARTYLADDQADDSLLSGAERQAFAPPDWWEWRDSAALMQEFAHQSRPNWQAKMLKLLWAIGGSTAGFVALFDGYDGCLGTMSDAAFDLRCQVLGIGAAAAMDAECSAAAPSGYDQTRRLHQLAHTHPDGLLEAQRLIADPQSSMAGGVLAGVLLAACDGLTADLAVYQTNRDLLYQGLTAMGYTCVEPGGTFYLLLKSPEPDANAFRQRAQGYDLLFPPTDDFACPGWCRIAFCTTTEQVKKALPIFGKLAKEYHLC